MPQRGVPTNFVLYLPNIYSLIRRPDHRRTIGNIECLLEFHQVRERPDGPEASRRMWIGVEPQFQIFIALIVPPDLREPEKETLLRGEAVDLWLRSFLRELFLQRHVGDLHAADVGDVFALGQLAVDMQSWQWLIARVLRHDRLRAFEVSLGRFRRPPIT